MDVLKKMAKDRYRKGFAGMIETLIDCIRAEIIAGKIRFPPTKYITRREGHKVRRIGIQNIKMQLFDYVAVYGLSETLKRIGYYQCAALPGKGQIFAKRAICRWLRSSKARCAWKADAYHYYQRIDREKLKRLLKRHVKNSKLLDLTFLLIDAGESGLSIGSFLSQYLANWLMSFAYHYAENAYKMRHSRRCGDKRTRFIKHICFYMDDLVFIGSSKSDLAMFARRFRTWIWEHLGVELKEDDEFIELQTGYIDMVGFLMSKKKVIARSHIFQKFRRDILAARKTGVVTREVAQRIVSRYGWIKNAQSRRWIRRNKADLIVEIAKSVLKRHIDIDVKNEVWQEAKRRRKDGKNVVYAA